MYELFEDAVGSIFQRKGDLELNHRTCGMKIGWLEEDLFVKGRLTLLKSLLSSLPMYVMHLFTIPTYVANRIEKLLRYLLFFLFGGGGCLRDDFKFHLVGWNTLCSPLKDGGLGV